MVISTTYMYIYMYTCGFILGFQEGTIPLMREVLQLMPGFDSLVPQHDSPNIGYILSSFFYTPLQLLCDNSQLVPYLRIQFILLSNLFFISRTSLFFVGNSSPVDILLDEVLATDNREEAALVGSVEGGGGPEPLRLAALLRTATEDNGELAAAAN